MTPYNAPPAKDSVRFTTIKQFSSEKKKPLDTPLKKNIEGNENSSLKKKYLMSTDSFANKRTDKYIPERTSIEEIETQQEREEILQ